VIVEITLADAGDGPSAQLLEPDDFKGFKVVLHAADASLAEQTAALGIARVDEHVWIRIDALRQLAGAAATPEWEASLQGMLEYARSKGWVDDELDAIRAHVERV
jgi:hypothetical protein